MDGEPVSAEEYEASSLSQPDTLITAQYLETVRRKIHLGPEKRLMLAVLEDGVICFQKNLLARTGKKKKLFQEAEDWILGEGSDWLFSFENICETLGLNPRYLRKGLMDWKQRKLREQRKAKGYRLNPGPREKSPDLTISEPIEQDSNRELKYGTM